MPPVTSLLFYRPTEPPPITAVALASFLRSFAELSAARDDASAAAQIKFGATVDTDDTPASWDEEVAEGIFVERTLAWDLTVQAASIHKLADALAHRSATLYRAVLELGPPDSGLCQQLQRPPEDKNDRGLSLERWSLDIGPVHSAAIGSDDFFVIGWVSLRLSGTGSLFPWTFERLVQRAETHPAVRQATELCKTTWPVDPEQPTPRLRRRRQRLGELWPLADMDAPLDWCWGLLEMA